ncbi:unnamed protein product [Nesidiocoris tenuis]|uniref:Uncharacterized protein n=1 Tax=Nesidiocoris tenuis TaxID=355587 RepID=A0A6H5G6I5_9HEMI|nr:unnamed protein product [Nesidiocoris tenuis]
MKSKDSVPKFKERSEEAPGYRALLLWMVRLIHADPMLMLNNQGKAGHEIQSSTLELINGLVSLVHQPNMQDIAQEAMEALLVLHQPEKIEVWNPEAPINTFWDVRFIGHLLRLLVCNNEKFGAQIQKNVKELVGHEMSAALYPTLFEQIKSVVEKFFDQCGQIQSL